MSRDDMQHDTAETHDKWIELCALATTNVLTDEEHKQLEEHLSGCAECREVYQQYSALAHAGLPPLAASYSPGDISSPQENLWDNAAAKERSLARVDRVAARVTVQARPSERKSKVRFRTLMIGSGLAAALAFALGLSIGLGRGYNLGTRAKAAWTAAPNATSASDMEAQKAALTLRLNNETTRLTELETNTAQREKEISTLQTQLEAINQQSAQFAKDKATEDQSLVAALTQQNALQNKLREAQQNYQAAQQELTALRAQRQQDQLHYASLEMEVTDLNHRLHDAEARVSDDTQYLASDRDIRELMGARQLYIADVIDMDLNGQPRKPFGRSSIPRASRSSSTPSISIGSRGCVRPVSSRHGRGKGRIAHDRSV